MTTSVHLFPYMVYHLNRENSNLIYETVRSTFCIVRPIRLHCQLMFPNNIPFGNAGTRIWGLAWLSCMREKPRRPTGGLILYCMQNGRMQKSELCSIARIIFSLVYLSKKKSSVILYWHFSIREKNRPFKLAIGIQTTDATFNGTRSKCARSILRKRACVFWLGRSRTAPCRGKMATENWIPPR